MASSTVLADRTEDKKELESKCVLDQESNVSSRGWNHQSCPLMVSSGLKQFGPLNCSPHIHHDNWKGLQPREACFLLQLASHTEGDVEAGSPDSQQRLLINVNIISSRTSRGEQQPKFSQAVTKFFHYQKAKAPLKLLNSPVHQLFPHGTLFRDILRNVVQSLRADGTTFFHLHRNIQFLEKVNTFN